MTNPEKTIFAVKRLIGRRADDPAIKDFGELVPYKVKAAKNGDAWIEVESEEYSPSQMSSFILRKLKEDAEAFLGENVDQAVITYQLILMTRSDKPQRMQVKLRALKCCESLMSRQQQPLLTGWIEKNQAS